MRTRVKIRAVSRLLALTTMLGLTSVIMPGTPASAATTTTTTCTLDVIRNPYNFTLWTVRVDCYLIDPTWTYDSFTLWGADTWYDDLLWGVGRWQTPGLPPWRVEWRQVNGFYLDEDWGTDELYAIAKIVRADGTSFLVTTNEVEGEYSY